MTNVCMTVASAPGTGSTITLGSVYSGSFVTFDGIGTVSGGIISYEITDGNNVELAWGIYTSGSPATLTRNTMMVNGYANSTPINASANALISSQDMYAGEGGGMVNKFRNGTFDIWQRGTSVTVTTAGGYTADGWIVTPTGASLTASSAAGRGPTVKSMLLTGAAGVTDVTVKQRIESNIAAPLTGQTVTVSAQIYNNSGAAITPTLTVKHANAIDNWTASTTDLNAASLRSCPNGQWTPVAYSFVDTGFAGNGLSITFDFGALGAGQTISITECDIRVTTGATLGINFLPTTPELRSIDSELKLCQRYYQTSYGNNVAPGTATSNGLVAVGSFNTSIPFRTEMRNAPTLGYWDAAGGANSFSSFLTSTPSIPISLGFGNEITWSGTTVTFSCSGAIQDGDTVFIAFMPGNTISQLATSITDGTNNYTRVQSAIEIGFAMEFWYCQNCKQVILPIISVTYATSISTSVANISVVRIPGAKLSGALDKFNAVTGNFAGSVSTGTLSNSNEVIFAATFDNGLGQNTLNPISGWTGIGIDTINGNFILQYKVVNSTASVSYTDGQQPYINMIASFIYGVAGTLYSGLVAAAGIAIAIGTTGFLTPPGPMLFHYAATAEL